MIARTRKQIAVLMGGTSSEREVSLNWAGNVRTRFAKPDTKYARST